MLSFISPLADSENYVTAPLTTTELGDVAVSSSTFPRGSFSYRPLQVLLLSCSLTLNPAPHFCRPPEFFRKLASWRRVEIGVAGNEGAVREDTAAHGRAGA